jgi:hypothetical protein
MTMPMNLSHLYLEQDQAERRELEKRNRRRQCRETRHKVRTGETIRSAPTAPLPRVAWLMFV